MIQKRWQKLALAGAPATLLAAALMAGWEGNSHTAYWDATGHVWTICAGHTRGVQKGDTASDAQCEAWAESDMAEAHAAVARCITVPLQPNQEAAFADAAFNLGPSVVCGSTLQRMANAGNVVGACLQLTDAMDRHGNAVGWDYSGGQLLAGLRNRRTDERDLCIGYYGGNE